MLFYYIAMMSISFVRKFESVFLALNESLVDDTNDGKVVVTILVIMMAFLIIRYIKHKF